MSEVSNDQLRQLFDTVLLALKTSHVESSFVKESTAVVEQSKLTNDRRDAFMALIKMTFALSSVKVATEVSQTVNPACETKAARARSPPRPG
jgi:hypothetical protein